MIRPLTILQFDAASAQGQQVDFQSAQIALEAPAAQQLSFSSGAAQQAAIPVGPGFALQTAPQVPAFVGVWRPIPAGQQQAQFQVCTVPYRRNNIASTCHLTRRDGVE
jgi:hypothetical protein